MESNLKTWVLSCVAGSFLFFAVICWQIQKSDEVQKPIEEPIALKEIQKNPIWSSEQKEEIKNNPSLQNFLTQLVANIEEAKKQEANYQAPAPVIEVKPDPPPDPDKEFRRLQRAQEKERAREERRLEREREVEQRQAQREAERYQRRMEKEAWKQRDPEGFAAAQAERARNRAEERAERQRERDERELRQIEELRFKDPIKWEKRKREFEDRKREEARQ